MKRITTERNRTVRIWSEGKFIIISERVRYAPRKWDDDRIGVTLDELKKVILLCDKESIPDISSDEPGTKLTFSKLPNDWLCELWERPLPAESTEVRFIVRLSKPGFKRDNYLMTEIAAREAFEKLCEEKSQ